MNIGWPEGIYIGVVAFNLLVALVLDGEPRKDKHSLSTSMLGSAVGLGILYWGGFFA